MAAGTSIWTSVIGLTSITDTTGAATVTVANLAPGVNLLSWSVVLGSLVSGWFGARMRSARLDQSMLQSVLADVSAMPAVRSAPNAVAATRMVTRKEIIGTLPETASAKTT